MRKEGQHLPLFETKRAKGRFIYRLFAVSIFVGICLIFVYRVNHIPKPDEDGRWAWIGLLVAELWFCFYWLLTQAVRWNRTYRHTFKERLSKRYEDHDLPGVDIYVCTADPTIEPPKIVINTVLSVMAYDYPPEKLSVYLSDDGGSEITFYALLEASKFAKYWLPYCKKFDLEPRSPAAHFSSMQAVEDAKQASEFGSVKKLYTDMENRIETATKLGRIPEEERSKHYGFSQWDSYYSRRDHDTILQILIDGTDPNSTDAAGCILPTLVYLAREKRPQHPHNFKAGAMNALIRVSSKISNGKITLNVDCDMYSNNSKAIRDALCFLMDEENGHEIGYVQFPQAFENVTKNELYSSSLRVMSEVEFHGLDGYGGPLYIGSGCFHRRDILCGRKIGEENKEIMKSGNVRELEEKTKVLASCTYEKNTPWGKEKGLRYGCPVEDVVTGLVIQSQGWKSVFFNPTRQAFIGLAPTTLPQALVQYKRWSEGDLLVLLSKFSPIWYARKKISLGLQLGYCCYCFWAPNCFPTLYYSILPSLYLLKGIPLFPKVSSISQKSKVCEFIKRLKLSCFFLLINQISSPWFVPFAYVVVAKYTYSLAEFLWSGGTILGWWNDQRMWLYKRASSYLFAVIDTVLTKLGFSESGFVITAKVADDEVSERYEKEIMEFGSSSPMFTVLATLALLNLYCLVGAVKKVAMGEGVFKICETMFLQILLCLVLVLINLPLYQGLFLRTDNGKMPASVAIKSIGLALFACSCFTLLY
ncbi:hypothetical protein UlMin_003884 [Ulmus minor]